MKFVNFVITHLNLIFKYIKLLHALFVCRLPKVRGLLVRHCGPPLTRKLNMDAWLLPVTCAGSCQLTNITLSLAHGEVTKANHFL
jgi:hypothetical protein